MKAARRSIPLALGLLALGGCGGDKVNAVPAEYIVEYSLTITGTASIDSVKYDGGTGAQVRVLNPGAGLVARLTPSVPFSVQATAWFSVTSGTVWLKQQWQHTGVSFNADSSSSAVSGSIALPFRSVP